MKKRIGYLLCALASLLYTVMGIVVFGTIGVLIVALLFVGVICLIFDLNAPLWIRAIDLGFMVCQLTAYYMGTKLGLTGKILRQIKVRIVDDLVWSAGEARDYGRATFTGA
jgi:hypothetical protein